MLRSFTELGEAFLTSPEFQPPEFSKCLNFQTELFLGVKAFSGKALVTSRCHPTCHSPSVCSPVIWTLFLLCLVRSPAHHQDCISFQFWPEMWPSGFPLEIESQPECTSAARSEVKVPSYSSPGRKRTTSPSPQKASTTLTTPNLQSDP